MDEGSASYQALKRFDRYNLEKQDRMREKAAEEERLREQSKLLYGR